MQEIIINNFSESYKKPENSSVISIQDINNFNYENLKIADEFYLINFSDPHYVSSLNEELKFQKGLDTLAKHEKKEGKKISTENATPVILLVTPYQHLIERAKELGFYVIAFWDKRPLLMDSLLKDSKADEYYVFDISDTSRLEIMVNYVTQQKEVNYIYHIGKESDMLDTYIIAEKHNKSLNSVNSISVINDKYLMRKFLSDSNLSTINYTYAETRSELVTNIHKVGYPCIIKPSNLTGSRGVFLCENEENIKEWETLIEEYNYNGPFLIEEYLEGKEVSVETLSFNGKHYIFGITDKIKSEPPLFVEYGHVHPSQLSEEVQQSIKDLVNSFLTKAGYTFGPAHTEIIVTENGPKIVESHARFGGDGIPRLVELATGQDMYKELFMMLKSNTPPIPNRPSKVAMVHSLQWPAGVLKELSGIDDVKKLPFLDDIGTPNEGDFIKEIKDSGTRHGFFMVSGNDFNDVENHVNTINSLIKFKIV
ncbi:D-ala D-ala ligase family protein (plasmid) [Bacillus pseudomycoides]|uniref:ATP-grasp domain-containing protein n=1 Tax=Bacillus TaxID=1386 RepID=UPI0003809E68|nr:MULTISPECIES: ATP-grasp domain-containing protein [Bacillus]AIK35364.1 D-ala D-ala ligase family protein [Bacillus pseudomycoides]AJI14473.1 D-ala D-ala ligase family protein [Bacillus pseudomycoides]